MSYAHFLLYYERAENHKAKEQMFNHLNERIFQVNIQMQGGSMFPGMRVHKFKGMGFCFADFISFIINIP